MLFKRLKLRSAQSTYLFSHLISIVNIKVGHNVAGGDGVDVDVVVIVVVVVNVVVHIQNKGQDPSCKCGKIKR